MLHRDGGQVVVPTAADGYGWASTASRELVGEVPGSGYLSPYGDRVASLVLRPGGEARALLWTPSGAVVERARWGGRPSCRRLPVVGEDLTLAP